MNYRIPFIKPLFPDGELLVRDYREIIESNWFTNFGPFENRLCCQMSDFLGSGISATTVANATLGLDLAIRALLKKKGKGYVLMPSFTFTAGAEALIINGFVPVFIDIDEETWQPDIVQARRFIKNNQAETAGILLCNIFGVGNPLVEEWESLAGSYELPLIIDSAAGLGSKYSDVEMVGSRGSCEVFSMHATKPFSVGEGGIVSSKNKDLIAQIRILENFGFDHTREIVAIGTNAKLQEINCAIGLRQLDGYEHRLGVRRNTLQAYQNALLPHGFTFQANDKISTVAFASVLAPNEAIAQNCYNKLIDGGVEVRRYYAPLHLQKALSSRSRIAVDQLKITENIASRILSLPVHDNMSMENIDYITNILIDVSRRDA